ncbi:uncharacterized protein LOC126677173 [Mercurialis annua]|uniref:uncharacterized protein LOC126677173 n=1 Tax=Mercurialis annua TaxID=3986 RepID=UPI0021609F99|nr:uncharacterized protein LOC126677173 [Mercurialis annua]
MNFDNKWNSWISSCFDSAQLSVLLNGCPTEYFFMEKGVHQGDPISPMLFVLAVESLRAIFDKSCNMGMLSGIRIDVLVEDLSILQFADDTLLFLPCDLRMIEILLRILRCFEFISGLKINYQKSSIIGINVDAVTISQASDILKCKIDELPITYLGLPLSDRAVGSKLWNPVISNFSVQLSTWRGNLLSPTGRLTLIKSVLCSISVYFLCTFRIPQSVVVSLERIISRFLWTGNSNSKGFSKVAWPDVCIPYSSGGLNITPLHIKNQCLLMKWIWKLIASDRNLIWFAVICSSYSFISGFDIESVNSIHLSHIWKGIIISCVKNSDLWNCFKEAAVMVLGDGNNIRFWQDKWTSAPLNLSFPDLFLLCRNKEATVSAVYNSCIWKEKVPPLIQFFVWLLARDRISSKDNLVRRRCNVSWVAPGTLDNFFIQWVSIPNGRHRKLWKLFWFYGVWHLWKARNRRLFDEETVDATSLIYLTIYKAVEFHRTQDHVWDQTGPDLESRWAWKRVLKFGPKSGRSGKRIWDLAKEEHGTGSECWRRQDKAAAAPVHCGSAVGCSGRVGSSSTAVMGFCFAPFSLVPVSYVAQLADAAYYWHDRLCMFLHK